MRRSLSLDAAVVGAVALGNWALLFANHTVVQVARDAPLWQLFPGIWGAVWMLACGLVAAAYPLRDLAQGGRFGGRDRAIHLAAIVVLFVVVPTIAMVLLRATGKPYTYVHDGAIMVEEAARKLLAGQDPYATDYLDTPLFYWPMINNPALYHFTYFPVLFLASLPFVKLFDALHLFFDVRYLYLPAYVATLAVLPFLVSGECGERDGASARRGPHRGIPRDGVPSEGWGVPGASRGFRWGPDERSMSAAYSLSLAAIVALDPELFPFVAEGRNDFFVLAFFFTGIALLQRERRTLGVLSICVAASAKLHAGLLLPFVLAYLVWRDRGHTPREIAIRLARAGWAGAAVLLAVFVPFLAWEPLQFWDDIVSYNAGGAAWSYPISGMGFSALLRASGVITFPQQDFPFWIFQLGAAIPLAAWSLRRLRADPSIATLLSGSAITLLAFLFFGRYFQGNYLGLIVALAAPVPFLRPGETRHLLEAARSLVGRSEVAVAGAASVEAP